MMVEEHRPALRSLAEDDQSRSIIADLMREVHKSVYGLHVFTTVRRLIYEGAMDVFIIVVIARKIVYKSDVAFAFDYSGARSRK
jgi:hypothetical protein